MAQSACEFHSLRRAFIMMPCGRLLVESNGDGLSHTQMLENIGIASRDVPSWLVRVPRGYFMNAEVCVYQGADMTPGNVWRLSPDNYSIVRAFMPKLRQEFLVNDNTNLYLGVRVGEIGHVWERLYKTTIGAFMR